MGESRRHRCRHLFQFDDLNCSSSQFREEIYTAFPQLREAGGYQFLKCVPNTRNLEALSSLVLTSPLLLKQRVGEARTYIRPIQRDLDLTKTDPQVMRYVHIKLHGIYHIYDTPCSVPITVSGDMY